MSKKMESEWGALLQKWPQLLLVTGLTVITAGMFLAAMGMAYQIDGWMGNIKHAKTWDEGLRGFILYSATLGQEQSIKFRKDEPWTQEKTSRHEASEPVLDNLVYPDAVHSQKTPKPTKEPSSSLHRAHRFRG